MIVDYGRYDATGLAALLRNGEVTPAELLEEAIRRVEAMNPKLNAVTVRSDDMARSHIDAGLPDGPFRGLPFLLKDLGAEAVDFPTNNGSRLYRNSTHTYDSEIYLRFREAGVVSFGRTASPELGIGPVTEPAVYGGPTRNPWNLTRTSGGSSGGAASVVAAGIIPAAHGSDGGGSVRIPASSCGLVGFKPTRARLPDGPGVGEGWGGMAIDGILTRSLRDTAAFLDATEGGDLGAPYAAPPLEESFMAAMTKPPGRLRIAFSTKTFSGEPIDPECALAVETTAKTLEDLGHDVFEFTGRVDIEKMMLAWTKIVACGTALSVHAKTTDPGVYNDLIDGVTRGAIQYAKGVTGADYLASVNAVHSFGREMARAFLDFDILLTATLGEPSAKVGRFKPDNEDFVDYRMGPGGVFDYSPYTAAFNASGQPAVSLPLHWTNDRLPVGVHLAAAYGEDEKLMSLSAQLEQAAPWADTQLALVREWEA